MRAFLRYLARGRAQAVTVASVCAALSLKVPPLSYVSGAVAGLMTLRYGMGEGGLVVAGSVALAGVFTYLVAGSPYPVLIFAATTWIPVWLLSGALRATASQGVAIILAGVLGALVILGMHVALDDPTAWWQEVLRALVQQAVRSPELGLEAGQVARRQQATAQWAPFMTAFLGAAVVLGFILTLYLARWWHALLDNPGGFGREFRALRLGRTVAGTVLAIAVLAVTANRLTDGLAADLLGPALVLYLFQGLAVVHGLVAGRRGAVWWLILVYAAMSMLPREIVMIVTVVGFADTWVDARRRWGRA